MWDEVIINGDYKLKSAQDARRYSLNLFRKYINNKIKLACENGENSCDIKGLNKNIQKELEDSGYEVIDILETTVIQW